MDTKEEGADEKKRKRRRSCG